MPPKARNNQGKRFTRQNATENTAQTTLFDMVAKKQSKTTTAKQTHPGQPKASLPTMESDESQDSNQSPISESSNPSTSEEEEEEEQNNNDEVQITADTTEQHKRVNHKSTNRRQCNRTNDEQSRSTPDRNNLTLRKHAFSTRLTLKMNCPASDDAESMLINILNQFIGELISADSTSALLPWKSIHRSKGNITKSADVPDNTRLLRTYLNRFYISRTPNASFITYPGINIGHNKPLPEIREEMQVWLQDGGHGLYYKMLQVEECSEIGWFLYSTKEMDAGALVDEIEDLVGVKLGLRWKVIDVGAKGKLPETQQVRALCVEVNAKYRWDVQRKLITYFGRNLKTLKEYPNGIRLRFVKNKTDAINSAEKSKIEKLRARQKFFLNHIVSAETWDIVQLDYASKSHEPTLRQMIMAIKNKNDVPLFHCVDLDWRGEGYVFQFSPQVKVEAECTINTLIPILKYKYPDIAIEKLFSHEANDRCEGLKFDPAKGAVVDELVTDHLTFIDEENLLGFSFATAPDEVNAQTDETRPITQALFSDSDSVSTLAQPGRSFITPSKPRDSNRSEHRSIDNTSITSSTSTVTMDTIMTLENKISSITNHLHSNDQKFDEIMQFLRSNNTREENSTTTNQNCTSAGSTTEAGDNNSVSSGVQ
jgi:hypothetical protein